MSARLTSRDGRTGLCPEDWVEAGPFTNVYEETKARGRDPGPGRLPARRHPAQRLPAVHRLRRFPDGPDPALQRALLPGQGGSSSSATSISPTSGSGADGRPPSWASGSRRTGPFSCPSASRPAGRAASTSSRSTTAWTPSWPSWRTASTAASITSSTPGRRGSRTSSITPNGFFRIWRGIEACGPEAFAARPRNALETLYDSYLEAYRPYMQDARSFDVANAAADPGEAAAWPARSSTTTSSPAAWPTPSRRTGARSSSPG
ncbi:MAG: hypothetical protein MZV64_63690 [Ignavibacteriales bacterium]|nr:hypothetical protein [Ignavibacteriales bacterium]